MYLKLQEGQSFAELLVTIGIMAIILPALLTGMVASRAGKPQQEQRLQAITLLSSTIEEMQSIRESGWSNIATDGTYHPVISGTTWALAPGADTVSGLTRQFVIGDVYRNNNGAIVASGSGTLDPSTKQLVATVSWNLPYPSSIHSTTLLTRTENMSFIHTTIPDFSAGITSGTTVVATTGSGIPNDGQVELGTGGGGHGGNWCSPNLNLTSVSLPQASSTNAIYAIPGKAFIGIGDISSQGNGTNFVTMNITQTYPPSASLGPTLETDNVYGLFGDANYSYLALDRTTDQMQIFDASNNAYKGKFNAPIASRGTSVYIAGTVGYLIAGNKLFTIDLSSVNGSRPQLAGSSPVTLGGTGVKVIVVGSYAYVVNSATSNQFQIINLSNYTVAGSLTLNNQPARELVVNASGDRAYVVTRLANGQNTFYIINTDASHKTSPSVLASGGTSGMDPHGINIVTGNKAIVVGIGGTSQYQVFNVTGDNITPCGSGLSVSSGIYGIASVLQQNGDAYSYITTGDSHFRVILGGNGANFASSGTFESSIFDTQSMGLPNSAFNHFSATINQPPQTTIQMQVAVAPSVGGSCTGATFNYVGPNGNSSAYFTPNGNTISGTIPFGSYNNNAYQNPNRCFRYKAYLNTTDTNQTPTLYDMSVNFSP